ncbi:CHAT domain-containing protein [Streptomyces sp. Sge12]|uniref:CHAT domain-containing protein n=1 Tax=Streptomyces sp. Sge12 TaxID=1972846 RepID=UPI0013317542|nr:CHAT domain-containing protein [Streptomyces sp. Sge12]
MRHFPDRAAVLLEAGGGQTMRPRKIRGSVPEVVTFTASLQDLLRQARLPPREVARRSGLPARTLSQYLRGVRVPPKRAVVRLIEVTEQHGRVTLPPKTKQLLSNLLIDARASRRRSRTLSEVGAQLAREVARAPTDDLAPVEELILREMDHIPPEFQWLERTSPAVVSIQEQFARHLREADPREAGEIDLGILLYTELLYVRVVRNRAYEALIAAVETTSEKGEDAAPPLDIFASPTPPTPNVLSRQEGYRRKSYPMEMNMPPTPSTLERIIAARDSGLISKDEGDRLIRLEIEEFAGGGNEDEGRGGSDPRRLIGELVEQAGLGQRVPLQVQIVAGTGSGVLLQPFDIPSTGAHAYITVHAPGLEALGDLEQTLNIPHSGDSEVLRFGLRTARLGLHTVTVRAYVGGSCLGQLPLQISVEQGVGTRAGPQRDAPLVGRMEPGEATLQVLKNDDGTYSFQLISDAFNLPQKGRTGDPSISVERIYEELKQMAKAAGGELDPVRALTRMRNHGVTLWDVVPEQVHRQFWDELNVIKSFTIVGEQDAVPWELLYPKDKGGLDGDGFLCELLPVLRQSHGQGRTAKIELPRAAFVVPPQSPPEAEAEVTALRRSLGSCATDGEVLTRGAEVQTLVEQGCAGLLHFACHNKFSSTGSQVKMADGNFDPVDLATAAQMQSLQATRPLVFFNACRSAGAIDWCGQRTGWASKFMEAGAGAFVGTLWPVRSDSALEFAQAFYHQLTATQPPLPLGEASRQARSTISDRAGDPTWLAYAVYGSPGTVAVVPDASGPES